MLPSIAAEVGGPAPPPPIITHQPLPSNVEVGERAVMECQGKGEGLLYSWYRNKKPYLLHQSCGKLEITSVVLDHTGEYYCVVENDGGRVESTHAKLTVCE